MVDWYQRFLAQSSDKIYPILDQLRESGFLDVKVEERLVLYPKSVRLCALLIAVDRLSISIPICDKAASIFISEMNVS